MSYNTPAQWLGVLEKIGEQLSSVTTTPDPDRVQDLLNDASGEVDGFFARAGLAVPITAPDWAVAKARSAEALLALETAVGQARMADLSQTSRDKLNRLLAWLEKVATGEEVLAPATPPASSSSTNGWYVDHAPYAGNKAFLG